MSQKPSKEKTSSTDGNKGEKTHKRDKKTFYFPSFHSRDFNEIKSKLQAHTMPYVIKTQKMELVK